jgi:hypothetical protein
MDHEPNSRLPTSDSVESDFSDSDFQDLKKAFESLDIHPELFKSLDEFSENRYKALKESLPLLYDKLCSEIEAVNIREFSSISSAPVALQSVSESRLSKRRSFLITIDVL